VDGHGVILLFDKDARAVRSWRQANPGVAGVLWARGRGQRIAEVREPVATLDHGSGRGKALARSACQQSNSGLSTGLKAAR
jgi:hypothetical protein